MNSIFRFISGNTSPQPDASLLPQEKVLECGAYPIRMSGSAEKASKNRRFSRRYFFLLGGSIGYPDIKGSWDAEQALQRIVENRNQNRKTFYLGPNVQLERKKTTITLTSVQHWNSEVVRLHRPNFQLLKDQNFNGVPLDVTAWKIQFDSESDAECWESAIRTEITASRLTIAVFSGLMMDRQKKLNDLIWLLIYQGNASLFCLYTSLTENTVEGTAQKNRTDIRSCSMIFDRLYFFTKTICNPASPHFEECFAFVLEKASTSDVVQRVMLLMCVMKESALAYRPPQYTVEEHLSDPIAVVSSASSGPEALEGALYTVSIPHSNEVLRFLSDFFLALPTTPPVRQAVLRAFHHPGKCNPPCLPTTDGKSDQPVVNWVEEIAWFEAQDRESRHIVIDLPTINLLFTSELSFLYCVMSQLFISKRDDDGSAAEDFAAIKDIFTKYLLPEDLGLAFEAPVDGEVITARHFVRLLLSTDLSMAESIELMQSMIAAGRVNKAVFTMIVEDGLLTCSYATLLQLVCATFFDQGDYTRMEFLPNSVQHIPDFPVIILQELWKHRGATVMGDSEFLPRLLSIVLRAEGYSQRGVEVATLSKEVKNTKFDADQVSFLAKNKFILIHRLTGLQFTVL